MATRRVYGSAKIEASRHANTGDGFVGADMPEILSLQVSCTHEKDGCEWRGELGTIKEHLQTCPHEPITCVCDEKIQRDKLQTHQQLDCPQRLHTCMLCQEIATYTFIMGDHLGMCPEVVVHCVNNECCKTFKRKETDKHRRECLYRIIQCTNKCGKEIKSIALVSHLKQECPQRMVTCSYCKDEGTYIFMTGEHLNDCPDHLLPCVNEGCEDNVKRRDMLNHCYQHCPHQVIRCGNGCGQDMKRCDLVEHEMSHCPKRIVKCAHCDKQGTCELILGDHVNTCPEVRLPCHNEGCREMIKRRNVEDHQDTCPHGLVSCPYSSVGCYSAVKRRDLKQHMNSDTNCHLSLAIDRVRSLEQHVDGLQRKIGDYQRETENERQRTRGRLDQFELRLQEQQRELENESHRAGERLNNYETRFKFTGPRLNGGAAKATKKTGCKQMIIVLGLVMCGMVVAPDTCFTIICIIALWYCTKEQQ